MNLSRTNNDPFRFLKRTRTTTPQKILPSPMQTKHDVSIQPILPLSIANSRISAPDDNPHQTHRYDPEKYYSGKCENYLALISFSQTIGAPQEARKKTSESVDSLQEIVRTGEKISQKRFPLEESSKELTFKKIEYEVGEGKVAQKEQRQPASFQVEDYEITDPPSGGEKRECGSCGRFFILTSYQKHVKICEQVFCKKRKPFSSEKQRSLSKGKKPQPTRK